jgi:DNA-binding NarL/FixJ family response regulator
MPMNMNRFKAEIIDKANLTARECEVLALICEAKPDKVIASDLGISSRTVHNHIDMIYIKMGLREASINARCAAIVTAVIKGMVRLSAAASSL